MPSTAESHVAAFIDSFVLRQHRDGWQNSLLERPSKARSKLGRAERQLDERFCLPVEDPAHTVAELASATASIAFFDGVESPQFLLPAEAIVRWQENVSDAIVSIARGRCAVFLFHEGYGWRCQREPAA